MKNRFTIVILIIIISLLFSGFVFAAEDLSLNEAVNILMKENRTLINARQDIEKAEKDIDLAVRSYFPTLDLSSSYTKFEDVQPQLGNDENYSTSVELSQPLWTGGKVAMQKEIAVYGLEIARSDYEDIVENQIFALVEGYYGVLQADGLVNIRREALDIANEHLRTVKNNLAAGIAIRRDLLQSQIEQRNAEEKLTAAKNNLTIARRRLAQLLSSQSEYNVNKPKIEFNLKLEQESLYKIAVENDPRLMNIELNKEIIRLNQKLEGQYYRPTLSLNGSYDWQGDEFMDKDSWKMTMGLNIPLYDGGKGGIKADQQQQELEKIDNKKEDLLEDININVEDSVLTVRETEDKIELERLSLENAEENLEIANKSYEAGVASNTDVIDAQATYNQAQISLLQSEYEYEIELFRTLNRSGRLREYFEDVIGNEN